MLANLSTIFFAKAISFSGLSDRETLIVSPIPSDSSDDIPQADFILASIPSPASVTPRCCGKMQVSSIIAAFNNLHAYIIVETSLAFIDTTILKNFSFMQMSKNSKTASTIPLTVLPYLDNILEDNEP